MDSHSDDNPEPPPSSTTPSRSRPPRSSPTAGPWPPRAPSSESLHFTALHSHAPNHPSVLKKRHSAYTLSSAHPHGTSSVPPPVPDLPPLRPPRNPARSSTNISIAGQDIAAPHPPSTSSAFSMNPQPKGRPRSRPSTATGSTREEITPWEFQASSSASLLEEHMSWAAQDKEKEKEQEREKEKERERILESPRVKPLAPSVKSRASSAGLGLSTSTGPVSEVTPWELYPAPLTPGGNGTTHTIASTSAKDVSLSAPSYTDSAGHTPLPLTPRKHTLPTGPIEDVTPWELEPAPAPEPVVRRVESGGVTPGKHKEKEKTKKASKTNSSRPESLSPPTANASIPAPPLSPSRRSLPYSDNSHSHHSGLQSAGQGTYNSYARSGVSGQGSLAQRPLPTGPMEEVTPWEMHPAPDSQDKEKLASLRSRSHSSLPPPSSPPPSSPLPSLPTHRKTSSFGHSSTTDGERPLSSNAIPEDRSEESHSEEQELTIPDLHDFSGVATARGRASVSSSAAGSLAPPNANAGGSSGSGAGATSVASHLSMAQMEEVLPWELFPVPAPKLSGTSSGSASKDEREKKTSRPGSSSHGKGLSDFGLRRRRSTGSKAAAAAAIAVSASTSSGGTTSGSGAGTGGGKARDSVHLQVGVSNVGIPNPPPLPENAPSSSVPGFSAPGPITPVASTSSITTMSSTSKGDRKSQLKPPSNAQDLKFSTADRTILEELKANIQAREAQFKIMGVGHTVVGGGKCAGKKYHPYPKNEVPYPRSYDREVVDLDVWETMFCLNICESLTWHVFETPPTKVLDIGCGTGTWLLHCARTWKECHFVGLDIVPLHPNLQNVGSPDLASRITWVQHNFLEVLPFQNEEFDFVHIKRISLGVPEDKWDKLFEEIHRVMKPGGAFEMIEEDLFFPGRRVVEQDDPSTRDDASSVTRRNSSSDRHRASINGHDEMGRLEHVAENSDPAPQTPATIHATLPATSRPGSPTTIKNGEYPNGRADPLSERKPQAPQTMVIIPPHSRSAARPLLHVKTQPTTGAYTDFVGLGGQMHPAMFGSSVSLLGTMGYLTIQDPLVEMIKESKRSRISAVMAPGLGHASSTSSDGHQPNIQPAAKKTKPSPFLLRSLTQTKAPTNPRDHTILAAVWHGMLGSRFVNPTPLSLLTTFLEYHFKDVRTHPPLLYTFPPVPVRAEEESGDESHGLLHSESESDVDGARDVIVPRPKRPRSTKSRKSLSSNSTSSHANESGEVSEEHRWLSMQALLKHKSPYITLDESRAYAYSPSNKSAFHLQKTNDGKMLLSNRISRLPNTTLHIDLRTLNLHLALRAKEVIACSEPMWHWVEKTQADAKAAAVSPSSSRGSRFRSDSIESTLVGSGSDADSSTTDEDTARNAILEMTRDDFDQLLNNFEMDMQDKASVGNALRERFNWQTFPSPILQDRKAFDLACEKYDNWAEQNKIHQPSVQVVHRSRNSFSNSGLVPPTPDSPDSRDHNLINRSVSSPQPSTTTSDKLLDDTTRAASHRNDNALFSQPLPSPSTESMPVPSQMHSRAMRVFVAWKAAS